MQGLCLSGLTSDALFVCIGSALIGHDVVKLMSYLLLDMIMTY
jgi:hypothetical protein